MKNKKLIVVLSAILMFVMSTEIAFAKKPPRGNNYIENGHLYVWYEDHYIDMGEYDPGP